MIFLSKVHGYLLLKLPAAYLCGVRVAHMSSDEVRTKVRHRWINQNPCRSLFWAVQGMAAELATGLLILNEVHREAVSMATLLIGVQGSFTKKARGTIYFTCDAGLKVQEHIKKALASGGGEVFDLVARGVDEQGDQVAEFIFTWSLKKRG